MYQMVCLLVLNFSPIIVHEQDISKASAMAWLIFIFLCTAASINCYSFGTINEYFCTSNFYNVSSLCTGIPLFCELHFNSSNCISVEFNSEDFIAIIEQGGREYTINDLVLLPLSLSSLELEVPFHPLLVSNVTVAIISNQSNCIFSSNETFVVTDNCIYPLTLSQEQFPSDVTPGETFNFRFFALTWTATSPQENVTLAMFHHPGLSVMLNRIAGSSSTMQNLPNLGSLDAQLDEVVSVANFDVPLNTTVTITFQVEVLPYILPNSLLFLQLYLLHKEFLGVLETYYIYYMTTSTTTEQLMLNSLVTNSNYLRDDILPNSLAPHRNENFTLLASFVLPCVVTNVSLNISLPQYEEDYGEFYYNITSITITSQLSLLSASHIFNYEEDFNVTTTPLADSVYPQQTVMFEASGSGGIISITKDFGVIQLDSCIFEEDKTIYLQLHGISLCNLSSRNESLNDNVTIELTYISEINQGNESLFVDRMFTTVTTTDTITQPLNVVRPIIELPISTHSTDALDNITLNFGVQHEASASGMTAWNMNYTFVVSNELDVGSFIEYCYVNNDNTKCTDLPFINYTVNNTFDM